MERYQIVRRRENVAGFSRFAPSLDKREWAVEGTAYRGQRRTTVAMRKLELDEEAIATIRARVYARWAAEEAARPQQPTHVIAIHVNGFGLPTNADHEFDDYQLQLEEART